MLRSEKTAVYRFNLDLPPHLPLAVRSVGEYALVPGSQMETPQRKWFSEVFWSEEGCGEFALGKRRVQVADCGIFYLLPGEAHDIRPVGGRWKYHWFTLDHPSSPQWLEAFGLVRRPIPARHCPVERFQNLREAVKKGTVQGDREASHEAHAILLAAMEGSLPPYSKPRAPWVERCRERIDTGYADPQLDIASIAGEMRVHRATLFRAFLSAYGMTPSRYLQNRRLHYAMELLMESDLPVKEVAERSGMNDANYLARLIQKVTAVSPLRFRARYRQPLSRVR